jgi:phosphoribosylformylglycinamidine (FGAM) synthase PurS component
MEEITIDYKHFVGKPEGKTAWKTADNIKTEVNEIRCEDIGLINPSYDRDH